MKKAIVLLAVLALLLAVATPSEAHWRGRCCWGGWWWPGAVIGGLAFGAAVAATAPFYYPRPYYGPYAPYYYAPPAAYAAPPVPYQASATYQPAAAPLVQREVVHPNGRYVLRGDGVTQPWQWIWIPAQRQ